MNRESENFFSAAYKRKIQPNRPPSHLPTEEKISVWPKKEQKNKPSHRKSCEKAARCKYNLFGLLTNRVQTYIIKAETPTVGGFGFVDYCQ